MTQAVTPEAIEMVKGWNDKAAIRLVGRRIVAAKYMTREQLETMGWEHCGSGSVMFRLDDGTLVIPSTDDEGNGPGALHLYGKKDFEILPVCPAI
jgi:hypothetical protein